MIDSELSKSFVRQISLYLSRKGVNNTISEDGDSDVSTAWIELRNYLDRRITLNPRTIHKSKEFDNSVELISDEYKIMLNTIIEKIAKGEDVNSHLSIQMFNSSKFDMLLNHWNIKHLHISDSVEVAKSAMHGNRSEFLLFAVFEKTDAYLLEVKTHPHGSGFTAYHFLEILHKNGWMKVAGFHVMEGVKDVQPHIESDEDIYALYKGRVNIPFMFEGICYTSLGVSSYGNKVTHSMEISKLKKSLSRLQTGTTFDSYIEDQGKLGFVYSHENKDYICWVNE